MPFSKTKYDPTVAIVVHHKWYPGDAFTFYFPKVLPQSALDAERVFVGLKEDEGAESFRKALVNVVAEMAAEEPEGFDDFPRLTKEERAQGTVNIDPLPERMRAYFDDASKPELEAILSGAWRAYRASQVPSAYTKSVQGHGAGGGQPSGVSAGASSGV
ncbi:MAG TPA: hypothetical protein VK422_18880 [Pyrinomonadaceae bacterium]|nr:hypothetical protein [Pyrinomonadaceae bacterium]